MLVNWGWRFGFCDEYLSNVWKCFYEALNGAVFARVGVEGFASNDKPFDTTTDGFTITGHFCGKILISLEL